MGGRRPEHRRRDLRESGEQAVAHYAVKSHGGAKDSFVVLRYRVVKAIWEYLQAAGRDFGSGRPLLPMGDVG